MKLSSGRAGQGPGALVWWRADAGRSHEPAEFPRPLDLSPHGSISL